MASQDETIALLSDPALWGGEVPSRIDTHISIVFLAGDRVRKLKKAVTLPFLDFSGVEARHAACLAELEINRRAAPDLYLGVSPVTRTGLGGDGEVMDWVVEMRRFDGETLFSRLAEQGRFDRPLMEQLTEAVARFHKGAPVRSDRGGVAGLTWTIDTNSASMAANPHLLPPDQAEELTQRSRQWLAKLAPLLEARRQRGMVRQCHGDLHLGNLCLFDGKPTLFDAIEFSEDIACIDVFYDLAFLLMDLDVRGAGSWASLVMNHYLDITGDYEGVILLPLLLSLRAAIRAHVLATIAAGQGGDGAEARRYLDAALAYLSPEPARLVAVGGLSGSGKSRMGRDLAPYPGTPGAAIVRTDALRKQIMGVAIHESLGPEGYTPEISARTYQALAETCAMLLKAGHPVVADAVFSKPAERAAIELVAKDCGVPFDGLWLEAPPELARQRIQTRKANVSDATVAVLERQLSYDLGEIGWHRIDSGQPKDKTLQDGLSYLFGGG